MFRRIRIALLLLILAVVALNALTDRWITTKWDAPLTVALFPINADGSTATEQFIAQLTQRDFAPLETFFQPEIKEFGINLDRPLRFTVAPTLRSIPPPMPERLPTLCAIACSLIWLPFPLLAHRSRWTVIPTAPDPCQDLRATIHPHTRDRFRVPP